MRCRSGDPTELLLKKVMDVKIKVDTRQVQNLGFDFRRMLVVGLYRVTERGTVLLRQEVPKVTHNLQQGISSDVDVAALRATLIVAARSGRTGAEGGLLHLPSGATREITLRASPAFDYAEAVARGTGIYGPKGSVIRSKRGRALLVPIGAGETPRGKDGKPEAYIESNGQRFIVRRFVRGRKPNPYDVRAAQRLEGEVQIIFDRVVQAFASQETAH